MCNNFDWDSGARRNSEWGGNVVIVPERRKVFEALHSDTYFDVSPNEHHFGFRERIEQALHRNGINVTDALWVIDAVDQELPVGQERVPARILARQEFVRARFEELLWEKVH